MAYDDRRIRQFFYMQIRPESVLPKNRIANDRLEFSEIPEELRHSKTAHYTDETILGRSEPWKSYGSSSSTVFNFTAKLVAQGKPADNAFARGAVRYTAGLAAKAGSFFPEAAPFLGIAGNAISSLSKEEMNSAELAQILKEEVGSKVSWLEALTVPQYDAQGRAFPPPTVDLVHGENFRRRGVVRQVSFTYQGPYSDLMTAYVVSCSITFEELNINAPGYLDVRGGLTSVADPRSRNLSGGPLAGTPVPAIADLARSAFGL